MIRILIFPAHYANSQEISLPIFMKESNILGYRFTLVFSLFEDFFSAFDQLGGY